MCNAAPVRARPNLLSGGSWGWVFALLFGVVCVFFDIAFLQVTLCSIWVCAKIREVWIGGMIRGYDSRYDSGV